MKLLMTFALLSVALTSCSLLPDKQADAENAAWDAQSSSMTQSAMANQQLQFAARRAARP